MADEWDADEWEDKPVVQLKPAAPAGPKAGEPDMSKFADEDEAEPDSAPSTSAAKPPTKKKAAYTKPPGPDDTPLDDPVAEKARKQRLIEKADFDATTELFGDGLDLDEFQPKSMKDFESLASHVIGKYVTVHSGNKHYKTLIKAMLKGVCEPLAPSEVKDVETSLAGLRADKVKAEAAALLAKKTVGKRAGLNMGKQGPGPDLDDYDTYGDGSKGGAGDDDYDFM